MKDMAQISTLDKLQRDTHDRVIRMEVKMDSLLGDMKEMKDGTSTTLANHEARIAVIEKDHNLVGGTQAAYQKLLDLEKIVNNYKTGAVIAGSIGGGLVFLISQVPSWIKLFQ